MKSLKRISCITVVTCLLYLAGFCAVFDVLGPPARTAQQWIGPAKRDAGQFIDIGGVYEYQGAGDWAYRVFAPCCQAWLRANGLD
ncbi:MAG: hypothetical protein AAGA29_06680 [Planctomycetota bacterium]